MSAAPTNNKPQRKQLSEQIDRLDTIIDCLGEVLPEAVRDACQEGTRQAVKDAILEIVSNPELRNLIAGLAPAALSPVASAPSPPSDITISKPGFLCRARSKVAATKAALIRRWRTKKAAVVMTVQTLAMMLPLKQIALVGAGIGVVVGLISYACPHTLTAVMSGIGGAGTAVAIQVGFGFHRCTRMLGLSTTS